MISAIMTEARSDDHIWPSADLIARALVLASMDLCELSILVKRTEGVLSGKVVLCARWVAYAAICAMHRKAEPLVLARLMGCGDNPITDAMEVRRRAWWSDDRVVSLIAALASGAPMQPIFTPDRAFGIMLSIRDRIEARKP
jgi:hypothetical protein